MVDNISTDSAEPNKAYTLLGFDFGMKRIGVAVGQTLTKTATPLSPLSATDGMPKWEQVTQLINEWQPAALIVGIPLNMDGTEQPLTHAARRFKNRLHERFKLKVFEVDERLTSVAARERLFNQGGYKALQKNSVDSVAAQLILNQWLTECSNEWIIQLKD